MNILEECFPININIIGLKPNFLSLENREYLENMGIDIPYPEICRIYIRSDIKRKSEKYGEVELPV